MERVATSTAMVSSGRLQAAVLQDGRDVQAGGVDLHLLPGRSTTGGPDEVRAGVLAVRAGCPGRSAGSASTLTSR